MMKIKKCIALLLCLTLIFALFGCSSRENGQTETQTDEEQEGNTQETTEPSDDGSSGEQTSDGNDTLVIFFSRTGEQYRVGVIDKGNTAIVAEMIADAVGADTFEIVSADDHYPMTYTELTEVAKQEQNDNARPAYTGEVPDLSRYKTIFIGAPVWWGDWPMILYTFFENNNDGLSGKTLIPFSTHEGSGLSGFDKKLAAAVPNSKVLTGLAIRGEDCQKDQSGVKTAVDSWIAGLEY